MSRHPSPGPSHSTTQISQQGPTVSLRQKQKPYAVGIAAGAEDAKYQTKYKELKRKVKEIESDNDKLHFKVLQAKRSIQRMKLERAILYERLSVVPPSPDIHDRHAFPPVHTGPGVPPPHQSSARLHPTGHQHREIRDHPHSMEPEHTLVEYIRTHDNPRVAPGPDGRPVPVLAPIGPGVVPPSHLSAAHSPRHASSGPGHESLRHMPSLPPVQHLEAPRGHTHPRSHTSPQMHHPHPGSSNEHHRSHSVSHSRVRTASTQPYHPGHAHLQQYPENLLPVQHVLHSPPLSERERERERPRHHDMHELASSHGDPRGHGHHPSPLLSHSSDTHSRSSSRIHNHQRIASGQYINRDEQHERQRDIERGREREWERERERSRDLGRGREMSSSHIHSPQTVHRSRQPMGDYLEHNAPSRIREEQGYYHDSAAPGTYPMLSRSGTPGSGSGSGSGIGVEGPSRPDSRTQFYEHDRARSYRLRPVNQPNEDIDFVHEDGRSKSRDRGGGSGGGNFAPPEQQGRSSVDMRKRTRNDMEVESENDAGDGPPGGTHGYSSRRAHEDRGSKRYQREHGRSVDNQEDPRMGPP